MERDRLARLQALRFDPELGLWDAFARVAAITPDHPALQEDDLRLSYGDVARRAENIAAHLIAAGLRPGGRVALVAQRSAGTLVAMLGVLRAGGAFIPLDPAYATEQLDYILGHSRPALILHDRAATDLARRLAGSGGPAVLEIGAACADMARPDYPPRGGADTAYVIYTSGSTGRPKGVVVPQRAVARICFDQGAMASAPDEVMLHSSTIAADGCGVEIWPALLTGGTVLVVPGAKPALDLLGAAIRRHRPTAASVYTGIFHLLVDHRLDDLGSLRRIAAGGDVMSAAHARRLLDRWPQIRLFNLYGPSETTVYAAMHEVRRDDLHGGAIPIGRPEAHGDCLVLAEDLTPAATGAAGQLAITGWGLADGYLDQPAQTAAQFIADPRPGHAGRAYLTGDQVRKRADGALEFLGRTDRQVKIGGRRIELDEVEHVMRQHPALADVAVVLADGTAGKRILAFARPQGAMPGDTRAFLRAVMADLRRDLPEGMLPRRVYLRDDLPLTANGKVDRKALLALAETPPPAAAPSPAAAARPDDILAAIAGVWDQILHCGPVTPDMTFFEAGGTSLQLLDAHAALQTRLGLAFDATLMFETPRAGDLARRLAGLGAVPQHAAPAQIRASSGAVAIIAVAARVPGAASLPDLWQHIRQGDNLIRPIPADQIEDNFTPAQRAQPNYVAARPALPDVDQFDAAFFGMYPREAALTDPQGRVFLEICHEVLEQAGHDPQRFAGRIGVWAGCSFSTYLIRHIMAERQTALDLLTGLQISHYPEMTGNLSDSLATRVAYRLDLKGPAVTVATACSTSLTALAQAVLSLRAGQCDMTLAGGVSITFPQARGYLCQEGGMVAPDGICRPFDAAAGGTVFGHGAGVVALRRLEDAQADGDRVLAVIRGVGLNNDGADKMSYTAPSVAGQVDAIRMAWADAGLSPADADYIECHGTATPLGDPIELRSLSLAVGPGRKPGGCALGAIKGNIGHLDAAAGVLGVIKAALVLSQRLVPPVANFRSLSPRIDLTGTPFHVPQALAAWQGSGPMRAGVSGFGVGGTNVHLALEEAPPTAPLLQVDTVQILPLAARTPEALDQMRGRLAAALTAADAPALADAAFTLQQGRGQYPWRMAIAATTAADAAAQLQKAARPVAAAATAPRIAFMFAGQGAQYPGMGAGLYREAPEFARWIDQGAEILRPILGLDLNTLLARGDHSDADAARLLRDTRLTQPALYLVQYALARLWQARGVMPAALIGHSVGEFAAAALAGVFRFEDGLHLIARRGQLMQDQPPGGMLSVRATAAELAPHLDGSLDHAAQNAPKLQVLSGPAAAISAMAARLSAAGIASTPLHTSHAFHSRMMDPVCAALAQECAALDLRAPQIPWVSTVTGDWITAEQATAPAYWAGQARQPVQFETAIRRLAEGGPVALLECGPGAVLSAFAAQSLPRDAGATALQSLPDHSAADPDPMTMARAFGRLWAMGCPVDWAKAGPRGAARVPLPTYPFQRKRHWIDLPAAETAPPPAQPAAAPILQPSPNGSVTMPSPSPMPAAQERLPRLTAALLSTLRDLSGEDLGPTDAEASFLELGFDSLFLGQFTQKLAQDFGCTLTFRQLLSDHPSVAALAAHLDLTLPPDTASAPALDAVAPAGVTAALPVPVMPVAAQALVTGEGVAAIVQAQLQAMQAIFAGQLAALGQPQPVAAPVAAQPVAPAPAHVAALPAPVDPAPAPAKPGFSIGRAGNAGGGDLTPAQAAFARDLSHRYAERFPKTKAWTQRYRATLADPRTVAGFRQDWKDLVFPVVADRAKGSRIHDIDGHSFVDYVNGFGTTAFGHAPDFVNDAVSAQLARGYAIGPQSDLAGDTAERFARLVGHERVTFCNTGSEAVMAAMRLARAVTGRDRVVVFSNDYHGQFDEVLVKGRGRGDAPDALPIAPGIPRSGLANMIVLPWGGDAALDWLRAHAGSVAAVLVEPVQSRHPEIRPAEFVRSLRALTEASGTALVMDEVVTGFRTGPRGMQGVWGIEADLATYGKVIGGGMPVGMLAGKRRFMDALDGGFWSYGDESAPQTAPTFFAGTFVRHPLVLAAVRATLDHIEAHGPDLWDRTANRMGALADSLNARLARDGLPRLIEGYSSWFVLNLPNHDPNATLLWPLMRLGGVHVQVGYAAIATTAHSEADFQTFETAFGAALDALQSVGIMAGDGQGTAAPAPVPAPVPESAADHGPVPLTEVQREIWMTSQLSDEASCSFNESASLVLRGALDEGALTRALAQVVARHDGLRQVFAPNGESFRILPPFTPDLARHDLTGSADPEAALAAILHADSARPQDLLAGPALRLMLIRRAADDHVLVVNAHHIICDGWSMNLIFGDLAQLYAAEKAGQGAALPPAPSFAAHARRAATLPDPEETARWWQAVHAAPADLPDLPLDHPRGALRSFTGATHTAWIGADLMHAARKAGAKQGCTLFATLFAALNLTLARLTGSDDLVIGVPTAGQALLADQALVGHCVNFLPVRLAIDRNEDAAAFLSRTGRSVMEAFEHRDYTYGTLVRALNLKRGLDRLPLTEVQFNLEKIAGGMAMGGLEVSAHPNPKTAVNFDLFFNMVESRDGLRVDVDYNADLYDRATIARWLGHLECLLAGLVRPGAGPVGRLPVLPAAALADMIGGLNDTARPAPALLPAAIAAQVALGPDRVALEDATGRITYAMLDHRARACAVAIRAALPGKSERVGILMRRGAGLVAAMLAVMRAGHVFVPLDPGHPVARLNAVLDVARVGLVLHDPDLPPEVLGGVLAGRNLLAMTDLPDADPAPLPAISGEDSAYILFTSGSTGTPKGVEISHAALANLIASVCDEPGIAADSSLLAVTTVSFDIALLELFAPLAAGGRVVIAAQADVLDGFGLVARLNRGDITHMQATPTLWAMLLEAGLKPWPGLTLLCGGEPLGADLAARLTAGGGTLWNLYGPTETTIWSALEQVLPGARVTIGGPLANTELHVLGPLDEIVPPGAVGELNIGGAGLAKGYFDRPDLTAAAFRMVDLGGMRRLYRSGDLARRLPDGRIEVLGRRDAQIKLRGFRIELEDVETALRAVPGVEAAAVALRPSPRGGDQLVGYVVGRQVPGPDDLGHALSQRLPGYMVPSGWVTLSELPRTANGKLDRRALPAPDVLARVTPLRSMPRTDTEQYLLGVWCDVLGIEAIGTRDTLYALGVDSLSLFRIAARLMDDGRNVMASDLMKHPSIEALAGWMDSRAATPSDAPPRPSLAAYRNGARRGA